MENPGLKQHFGVEVGKLARRSKIPRLTIACHKPQNAEA